MQDRAARPDTPRSISKLAAGDSHIPRIDWTEGPMSNRRLVSTSTHEQALA